MNYYLNVSLIGSSTKNDRCQDVTGLLYILWIYHLWLFVTASNFKICKRGAPKYEECIAVASTNAIISMANGNYYKISVSSFVATDLEK